MGGVGSENKHVANANGRGSGTGLSENSNSVSSAHTLAYHQHSLRWQLRRTKLKAETMRLNYEASQVDLTVPSLSQLLNEVNIPNNPNNT